MSETRIDNVTRHVDLMVTMPVVKSPSGNGYDSLSVSADGSLLVTVAGTTGGTEFELVVTTYVCSTAFAGASVGDIITCTQVLNVTLVPPVTASTVWRNQTTAADLVSAPPSASLTLVGTQGLTLAQLASLQLGTAANQVTQIVYADSTLTAIQSLLTQAQLNASLSATNLTLRANQTVQVTGGTLNATVTNLPAVQTVNGSVGISGNIAVGAIAFNGTQPVSVQNTPNVSLVTALPAGGNLIGAVAVSGNATVNGSVGIVGSVPVTGTFFQTTQPVSLAANVTINNGSSVVVSSLPALPAGGNLIGSVGLSGNLAGITGGVALTNATLNISYAQDQIARSTTATWGSGTSVGTTLVQDVQGMSSVIFDCLSNLAAGNFGVVFEYNNGGTRWLPLPVFGLQSDTGGINAGGGAQRSVTSINFGFTGSLSLQADVSGMRQVRIRLTDAGTGAVLNFYSTPSASKVDLKRITEIKTIEAVAIVTGAGLANGDKLTLYYSYDVVDGVQRFVACYNWNSSVFVGSGSFLLNYIKSSEQLSYAGNSILTNGTQSSRLLDSNGVGIAMGATVKANALPVTLATDQPTINTSAVGNTTVNGTVSAAQSGAWTFGINNNVTVNPNSSVGVSSVPANMTVTVTSIVANQTVVVNGGSVNATLVGTSQVAGTVSLGTNVTLNPNSTIALTGNLAGITSPVAVSSLPALPPGTNFLGNVSITAMPNISVAQAANQNVTVIASLPAGTAFLGNVSITAMPNVTTTASPNATVVVNGGSINATIVGTAQVNGTSYQGGNWNTTLAGNLAGITAPVVLAANQTVVLNGGSVNATIVGTVPVSLAQNVTINSNAMVGVTGNIAGITSLPTVTIQPNSTVNISNAVTLFGNQSARILDTNNLTIDSLSAGTGANGLLTAKGATNFFFSTQSTTTAQLAAGATFNGAIESVVSAPFASVIVDSDQPGVLTIKQYITSSAATQISSIAFTTPGKTAGNCFARSFAINGNFFSLSFQNTGAVPTTTLNVNAAFGDIPATTSLLNDPVSLNEVNGTSFSLGQQFANASLPVTLATNQPALNVSVVQVPTITKSSQGATGLTVQNLLDAGRSARNLFLDTFAVAATAETLNTVSYSVDNGTPTTGTSYSVTAGKRFRLQAISCSLHTITGNTVAVSVLVRIRVNNAGTAIISSPVQMIIPVPGIAAANGASSGIARSIPDGWEFPAGAGIAITTQCAGFVTTTAAPKVDISLIGFEY